MILIFEDKHFKKLNKFELLIYHRKIKIFMKNLKDIKHLAISFREKQLI